MLRWKPLATPALIFRPGACLKASKRTLLALTSRMHGPVCSSTCWINMYIYISIEYTLFVGSSKTRVLRLWIHILGLHACISKDRGGRHGDAPGCEEAATWINLGYACRNLQLNPWMQLYLRLVESWDLESRCRTVWCWSSLPRVVVGCAGSCPCTGIQPNHPLNLYHGCVL